jgi:hypothetical protein
MAALTPLVLVLGCGGGGEDVSEDERVRQINGVAELATNAYAAAGPEGLFDYLAKDVAERCPKEQLAAALGDEQTPEGFRGVSDAQIDGDEARAQVMHLFGDEERAAEWHFVLEDEESWRITSVPGLEECTS